MVVEMLEVRVTASSQCLSKIMVMRVDMYQIGPSRENDDRASAFS